MVAWRPRINRHIPDLAILQTLTTVTNDLKWLAAVRNVLKMHLRNLVMERDGEVRRVIDLRSYMDGVGDAATNARAIAYIRTSWMAERELTMLGIVTAWMKSRVYCVKRYLSYVEIAERDMLSANRTLRCGTRRIG